WVPFSIGRVRLATRAGRQLHARGRVSGTHADASVIGAAVDVFNEQHELVATVADLSLGRVTASALRGGSTRDWFYTVDWEPLPARVAQQATASGHWVVFADDEAIAER